MVDIENEEINKKVEAEEEKKEKKINISKYEKLQAEMKILEAERDEWKNKYYGVYANMENLRKSIEKDHREALKYRAEGFVEKLLPSLDTFHMAVEIKGKTPEMDSFITGFKYITTTSYLQSLMKELQKSLPKLVTNLMKKQCTHSKPSKKKAKKISLLTLLEDAISFMKELYVLQWSMFQKNQQ